VQEVQKSLLALHKLRHVGTQPVKAAGVSMLFIQPACQLADRGRQHIAGALHKEDAKVLHTLFMAMNGDNEEWLKEPKKAKSKHTVFV
jgi:hypothetical protein